MCLSDLWRGGGTKSQYSYQRHWKNSKQCFNYWIWNKFLNNNHLNELGVIKVKDLITWNNCLFVFHHLSEYLLDAFASYHHATNEHQNSAIRGAQKCFWMYTWKETCTMDQTLSRSIFVWNNIMKIIYNWYGESTVSYKSQSTLRQGNNNNSWICNMHIITLFTLYFYSLFSQWIIKL